MASQHYNDFKQKIASSSSYNDLSANLEAALQDPFALSDDEAKSLGSAAKRREKQLDEINASNKAIQRREGVRSMLDALSSVSVKGSGVNLQYGIRNGKRVPLSGPSLSLPSSGAGEGDQAYAEGISGLKEYFKGSGYGNEEYAAPPRPGQEKIQRYSLDELVDKEGAVPSNVYKPALTDLLKEAAGYGDLGTGELGDLATMHGLSKKDTSSVRGAIRRYTQSQKAQARQQTAEQKAKEALKAAKQREKDAQNKFVATITNAVMKKVPTRPAVTSDQIAKEYASQLTNQKVLGSAEVYGPPPPPPDDGSGGGGAGGGGDDAARELARRRREQRLTEDKYAGYLRDKGRSGEIGSHAYNEVLYKQFQRKDILTPEADKKINSQRDRIASGEAAAESRAQREQARENLRKVRQASQGRKQSAADAAKDAQEKERERKAAEKWLNDVDRDAKRKAAAGTELPSTKFYAERKRIEQEHNDDLISNGNGHMMGGKRSDEALAQKYKSAGVHLDSDFPKQGASFDLYKGAMLAGAVFTSIRSGIQVGNAVSALAKGMSAAVLGAGGAFAAVGDAILAQILSPFGSTGQFASKLASGLAGAAMSAVKGLSGILQAGLKIGAGIGGGAVFGGAALAGAGIGALVGGLPTVGVGALPGAVAGAGIVAALGSAVSSLLTNIGGAVGSALGAIGTAFGEVGKSVADAIGNIKAVLTDLISSATKFATATATLSRTGGFSMQAGSGVASLSRILTGSPDGLNGLFNNFGHNSAYIGAVAGGFGVKGVNGKDPLSFLSAMFNRYQQIGKQGGPMANINQNILLHGLAGGDADQIGALFAGGPGVVQSALAQARKSEQSGGDTKSALKLNFEMAGLDTQVDKIRRTFLMKLLPVVNMGLSAFGNYLDKNSAKIVSNLEKIGKWFFVQFPHYIRQGIKSVFEFGKSFALILPEIAGVAKNWTRAFVVGFDLLLPLFKMFSSVASALAINILAPLSALGLVPKDSVSQVIKANSQIALIPELNPLKFDKQFDALAFAGGKGGKWEKDEKGKWHQSGGIYRSLEGHEESFFKGYDSLTGSQSQREKSWDKMMAAANRMNMAADKMDKAADKGSKITVSPSDQFIIDVSTQSAELHLRALTQ